MPHANLWITVAGFVLSVAVLFGTISYYAGQQNDRLDHIEADVGEISVDIRSIRADIHDIDRRVVHIEAVTARPPEDYLDRRTP